jgi:YD repeat-containing protein
MKKYIVYSLLIFNLSFGQEEFTSLNKNIFNAKSPEVSSLITANEYDVNLFKGTPNIAIPIFSHQGKKTAIDISLSYDASGIKVNQLASWIGLGWNLNVGGVITRNANGLPDDYNTATPTYYKASDIAQFMNDFDEAIGYNNLNEPSLFRFYQLKQSQGLADYELDTYSYSCGSLSGTIVIDYSNNTAVDLENPNYKVSFIYNNTTLKNILSWKIIDDYGNQYFFENIEKTKHEYSGNFGTSALYDAQMEFNSSWKLTKIKSANNEDFYEFIYSSPNFYLEKEPNKNYSYNDYYSVEGIPYNVDKYENLTSYYYISDSYLSQINYNSKLLVQFNTAAENRKDLPGKKRLETITINSGSNLMERKTYSFETSYYNNSWTGFEEKFYKRLKLDKLKIYGALLGQNEASNDYIFEYESDELPKRFSFDQDFWGYYNGNNNSTLIPKINIETNNGGLFTLNGANRRPNLQYAKKGILKSITYPTKGQTRFEYELHGFDIPFETTTHLIKRTLNANSGGYNFENTYNYNQCDDIGITNNNRPNESVSKFYIPESGNYTIYFEYSNSSSSNTSNGTPLLWAGMYVSSEFDNCVDVNQNGNIIQLCPNNYKFCELLNNATLNIFLQNGISYNPNGSITIYLNQGYYSILSVNNTANFLNIYKMEEENESIRHGYGLRIKEINSYNHNNQFITKKSYYYGNLIHDSINPNEMIPFSFNANILTKKPKFHEGFLKYNFLIGFDGGTNPFIYRRYAHPIDNDIDKYGYEYVTEIIKSEDESCNGFTIYKFNLEGEPYLHYAQGYLNNGQWELSKQIQKDPMMGKLMKIEQFDSLKKLVKSSSYEHQLEVIPYVSSRIIDNINPMLLYASNAVVFQNSKYYYKTLTEDAGENSSFGLMAPGFCISSKVALLNNLNPNQIVQCTPGPLPNNTFYKVKFFKINNLFSKSIDSLFHSSGTISNSTENIYENNSKIKDIFLSSTNQTSETKYQYASNIPITINNSLIAKNMRGIPLKTETFKNGEKLSTQETVYKDWGNNIIAPEIIKISKGNLPLEDRIKYNTIDNTNGNPLEIEQIGGVKVCYIWGYNKTLPIAKIENATYAQVQAYEVNLQNLSNTGTEANLITALNNLRAALPNAMITTYTHKPLIGISTVTDPKGNKQTYHYDSFNRLQYVKDAQGNIVSENEYHYKN